MNRRNFLSLLGGACCLPFVKLAPKPTPKSYTPAFAGSFPLRLDDKFQPIEPVDLQTNQFNQAWVDAPYEVGFVMAPESYERLVPNGRLAGFRA
jgi:hypothetical protein